MVHELGGCTKNVTHDQLSFGGLDGNVGERLLGVGVAVEGGAMLAPLVAVREEHETFVGGTIAMGEGID